MNFECLGDVDGSHPHSLAQRRSHNLSDEAFPLSARSLRTNLSGRIFGLDYSIESKGCSSGCRLIAYGATELLMCLDDLDRVFYELYEW